MMLYIDQFPPELKCICHFPDDIITSIIEYLGIYKIRVGVPMKQIRMTNYSFLLNLQIIEHNNLYIDGDCIIRDLDLKCEDTNDFVGVLFEIKYERRPVKLSCTKYIMLAFDTKHQTQYSTAGWHIERI